MTLGKLLLMLQQGKMIMSDINIPRQNLPIVDTKKINYQLDGNVIRRYFVKRVDGKFTEVDENLFSQYRNNPYFENVIINWYIRGTEDFVKTQNIKELNETDLTIKGIRKLIVNPLQLYQGER